MSSTSNAQQVTETELKMVASSTQENPPQHPATHTREESIASTNTDAESDEDDLFTQSSDIDNPFIHQTTRPPKLILHEMNFLSLPWQSNVYGLVAIQYGSMASLLVATLKREIFKLTFEHQSLRPSLKPVAFSYIPGKIQMKVSSLNPLQHQPMPKSSPLMHL